MLVGSKLPMKGLVVVAALVGAALAVPAGAWASMPMSMPMPSMHSMPSMPSKPTTASRPGPPIPNGVYRGTTNRGARVTIRVGATALTGTMHATFQVSCVPGQANFSTSSGTFKARSRNFAATGTLNINVISGRIHIVGHPRCSGTTYQAKLASPAGVKKTVVRYKTVTLKPMGMTMPMSSNTFNMMGSMKDFMLPAQKPCGDCYIVGMTPNLVYPNGKIANYNTGAMLHHYVMFNNSAHDVSCPGWGQRAFGSGNERTPFVLPAGYGLPVKSTDNWSMLLELMNTSMHTQNVAVQVTYYTMPASAHLRAVTPLWLDERECGASDYPIPAGHSDAVWNYKVPATAAGDIVAIGGHQHDYGTHISLTNTTSHKLICNSRAGYGDIAAYEKNIDYMSGCIGNPVATIHAGDNLRLDSYYNSPVAENGVMGIMMAYVAVGQFTPPHASGSSMR